MNPMVSATSINRRALFAMIALALVAAAALGSYLALTWRRGLPAPGSEAYEQTTRRFYRGLAGLQVGLVDAARQELIQATELAPGEPAVWADLGLSYLRLGEFEPAAAALERAAKLAPSSSDVAFLSGRLETSRGRRDEGIAHLRRAVELDPRNLHARTALIQEVENAGGPDADAEAQRLLEALVNLQPRNPAVLIERARLAAKRGDAVLLRDSVARLEPFAGTWPPEVIERYRALRQAVSASNTSDAARAVAFLRNVLAREPAYRESRSRVTPSAELVATPITRFLRLATPLATPSAPDTSLTFTRERVGAPSTTPGTALTAFSLDGDQPPAIFAADSRQVTRLDLAGRPLPLPDGFGLNSVLPLDWTHDFKMDLVAVGTGGVRLFVQEPDGTFGDATARASQASGPVNLAATGAWAADIEMDGDLDIVVGVRDATPVVLRNNGDGTWRATQPFPAVRRHFRVRLGRSRRRRRSGCGVHRRSRRAARLCQHPGRTVSINRGTPRQCGRHHVSGTRPRRRRWRARSRHARHDG